MNLYEVGKVYIWQNLVRDTYLNGTECTVIGNLTTFWCNKDNKPKRGQMTDNKEDNVITMALAGQLRPKNPPSGEKMISELIIKQFDKELENA